MKCSKKRKSGMQVKRYQSGGGWPPGGVDPMERIVKERQAAEYGQLLDYLQRFDQGEIRQAPESAFAGATVLEMMSNPVGAARAAMEQGRRPTKDEIAMAGRKAGPMADVMAISYPAMTAYGLKEGMPGASLVPHSRPFEPSQPMRVVRSIDQGDDAVRSIRKAGYVDYQPASYAIPTNIYREGQDAALDYIAKRQALFKTPEMQRRNAERIAAQCGKHTFVQEARRLSGGAASEWTPAKRPDLTPDQRKLYEAANVWLCWSRPVLLPGGSRFGGVWERVTGREAPGPK